MNDSVGAPPRVSSNFGFGRNRTRSLPSSNSAPVFETAGKAVQAPPASSYCHTPLEACPRPTTAMPNLGESEGDALSVMALGGIGAADCSIANTVLPVLTAIGASSLMELKAKAAVEASTGASGCGSTSKEAVAGMLMSLNGVSPPVPVCVRSMTEPSASGPPMNRSYVPSQATNESVGSGPRVSSNFGFGRNLTRSPGASNKALVLEMVGKFVQPGALGALNCQVPLAVCVAPMTAMPSCGDSNAGALSVMGVGWKSGSDCSIASTVLPVLLATGTSSGIEGNDNVAALFKIGE